MQEWNEQMDAFAIKLLTDLFGVVIEVLALRYFLQGFLGKTTLNGCQEGSLYASLMIAFWSISTFVPEDYLRTLGYGAAIIIAMLFYPGRMSRKGIVAIFYLAFLVLIEIAVYSFFVLYKGMIFDTGLDHLENYIIGSTVSKFILILLVRGSLTFKDNVIDEKIKLPMHWFFPLMIMPVISLIVLYLLSAMALKICEVDYFALYLLAIILMIAANLAVFYLFDQLLESENYKRRAMIAEQYLHQQTEYYTAMTDKNRYIRGMYHDMKNILLSLSGYLQNNDVPKALERIEEYGIELRKSQLVWTRDPVLDTVIETKLKQAEDVLCQIEVSAALPQTLECNSMDLGVILANGLDNAIEAAQQLIDPQKRKIKLKLSVQNNFVVMQIKNAVKEKVQIDHQHIKSTKENPELHGLGLENMRQLAERNEGELFWESNDDSFILTVMIKTARLPSRAKL